jgi:hypothetical protein
MGFVMGPVMFFWIYHDTTLTTKLKLGVLGGVGINFSFAFIRFIEYLI